GGRGRGMVVGPGSEASVWSILAGGESHASAHAIARGRSAPRRGARIERVRGPTVGAARGVRVWFGRRPVSALSSTRSTSSGIVASPLEKEWVPHPDGGRHRT